MRVTSAWKVTALTGVLCRGWIAASDFGSAPDLAIAYHIRVETRLLAMETAIIELSRANNMTTQPAPQNRRARTKGGISLDAIRDPRSSGPQPIRIPHEVKTR